MPDQQQTDEVKKRVLFGVTDFKRFEPYRNSVEQFLIADPGSHQWGIYGTYVTTHRISARTLAHVRKVCRWEIKSEERGGVTTDFTDYTDSWYGTLAEHALR